MPDILSDEQKAERDGVALRALGGPVPTWVYGPEGAQLMELVPGLPPPKGFSFSPVASDAPVDAQPTAAPPPSPVGDDRYAELEARIVTLEAQMVEVGEYLEAMSQPAEQTPASPGREALVARAKELKLEFHNRLGDAKLAALIAEAEAAQKPVEGE